MRRLICVVGAMMLATAAVARGEPPTTTANGDYVSRAEYEKLKQEQEATRKEMEELKRMIAEQHKAPPPAPTPAPTPAPAPAATAAAEAPAGPTSEDFDLLESQVKTLKGQVDRSLPGTSNFTIHGDMDVSYVIPQHGTNTFSAGIAPLILWRPTDRILVEAAADIGIDTDEDNNSSTSFDLTIADISFLVNDNLAVGGGLFVVPFGVFHNHFDPPWINKFPDEPLPFGDNAIAPSSEVGLFARGAVPVRSMKFTYDAYLTNGPNLNVNNPDSAGTLNFDDFTDLNNGKAVGGRIGFLPLPNIEVGYSVQFAAVDPSHFENVNAFLQAADVNWRQDVPALGGAFDTRAEWVWSNVDRATYDPTGALGFGPVTFSNYRQGGYVQLCYRPTHAGNNFVRNVELVSRYDVLIQPLSAPGGDHEQRFTFGIDYWVTPAIVLKAAYQIDDKQVGEDVNAFLFQIGIGF